MNVSVLLRILPVSRTGGRLAGQAELVETGETRVFADHDEMLAFLRQVAGSASPELLGRDRERIVTADRDEDAGAAMRRCP